MAAGAAFSRSTSPPHDAGSGRLIRLDGRRSSGNRRRSTGAASAPFKIRSAQRARLAARRSSCMSLLTEARPSNRQMRATRPCRSTSAELGRANARISPLTVASLVAFVFRSHVASGSVFFHLLTAASVKICSGGTSLGIGSAIAFAEPPTGVPFVLLGTGDPQRRRIQGGREKTAGIGRDAQIRAFALLLGRSVGATSI